MQLHKKTSTAINPPTVLVFELFSKHPHSISFPNKSFLKTCNDKEESLTASWRGEVRRKVIPVEIRDHLNPRDCWTTKQHIAIDKRSLCNIWQRIQLELWDRSVVDLQDIVLVRLSINLNFFKSLVIVVPKANSGKTPKCTEWKFYNYRNCCSNILTTKPRTSPSIFFLCLSYFSRFVFPAFVFASAFFFFFVSFKIILTFRGTNSSSSSSHFNTPILWRSIINSLCQFSWLFSVLAHCSFHYTQEIL